MITLHIKVLAANLGCVSLRKSTIGFLNPKESENGFSVFNRSIRDLSDHGASKEPKNPLPDWILWFSLTHHDLKDLVLICLVQKRKIHFWNLSDLLRTHKI